MDKISPYQKQVLAYLECEGKGAYGFANLRSHQAMQKKGLIDFSSGFWKLTEKGKEYTTNETRCH